MFAVRQAIDRFFFWKRIGTYFRIGKQEKKKRNKEKKRELRLMTRIFTEPRSSSSVTPSPICHRFGAVYWFRMETLAPFRYIPSFLKTDVLEQI